MKRLFLVFLLFLCPICTLTVVAASYSDEMSKLDAGPAKIYQNLAVQPPVGQWASLPDKSFLRIGNPGMPQASVTYQLQNAQSVALEVYSAGGSLVTRTPEGRYLLGPPELTGGIPTGIYAQYSPSMNAVFAKVPEGLYRLYYDRLHGYLFLPVSVPPPGDLVAYGVNILSSTDGVSYQLVPSYVQSSRFYGTAAICGETRSAMVPASCRYLKIEINDVSSIPLAGGSVLPKAATTMTMLANVSIDGEGLIIGIPEPIVPESSLTMPPPPEFSLPSSQKPETSKPASSKSASSKATASKQPAAKGQQPAAEKEPKEPKEPKESKESKEAPAVSTPTQKFDGSVVVGEKSKRSTARPAVSPAKKESSTASAPASAGSSPAQSVPEKEIYYVPAVQSEDSMTIWIRIYILVAVVFLGFLLLRRDRKAPPKE